MEVKMLRNVNTVANSETTHVHFIDQKSDAAGTVPREADVTHSELLLQGENQRYVNSTITIKRHFLQCNKLVCHIHST
jgi:hypothetical protein